MISFLGDNKIHNYPNPVFEVMETRTLRPSFSGNWLNMVICHWFPPHFTLLYSLTLKMSSEIGSNLVVGLIDATELYSHLELKYVSRSDQNNTGHFL